MQKTSETQTKTHGEVTLQGGRDDSGPPEIVLIGYVRLYMIGNDLQSRLMFLFQKDP